MALALGIPEDINYFLLESEQRQGALAAGVFVSPVAAGGAAEGREESGELQPPAADAPPSAGVRVDAGGGWYVQLLPFAAEESIVRLEENIAKLASRSPTSLVREGLGPREIVDLLLDGLEPVFADDKPARVLRTMALIPREELEEMLTSNEVIEAKCEFCGTLYRSTPEELREKLEARE
ncbi:hypothetical protein EMIHUDRAFT_247328 [Emiliania huxleyi CCMP1516]|uniref:Uncharacterized protein n=2 Tax=Emiliania huxleyi TaxID=2903 RepID=A0A0D3IN92_EMIH1|nr:hypothetical protein EMIHUDRAFT_247328 [Emiliania huxleyi CCMP1516]EOD12727.1 hypothetical protein EMIHUDRAFT_247328 [Emiliania huxleyi CCMP1516]|eukprot:XP_005765156.1 hypothetical protein EMIHUDRAFT_247328 [Emiliania huxleyi CCMP1516]